DVQVRVAGRISEFAGEGAALIVEHVGDQHLAAAVDDLPGERSPQATRPTGDEDDLVGEYCFLHRGLLPGACGASCGPSGHTFRITLSGPCVHVMMRTVFGADVRQVKTATSDPSATVKLSHTRDRKSVVEGR